MANEQVNGQIELIGKTISEQLDRLNNGECAENLYGANVKRFAGGWRFSIDGKAGPLLPRPLVYALKHLIPGTENEPNGFHSYLIVIDGKNVCNANEHVQNGVFVWGPKE